MTKHLSPRIPISNQEAKEQAADYFGFAASVKIQAGDEIFEIPNPGLLDDDQQERWEELQFELEKCDREPDIDIAERELEDGTVIPASTVKGDYLKPYRIKGELLKPSYNVRVAQVLFGERYEAFKKAGGSGNQVGLIWAQMNDAFQKRVKADSKSDGSDSTVEDVPEGD
jgi:hypothetical protein